MSEWCGSGQSVQQTVVVFMLRLHPLIAWLRSLLCVLLCCAVLCCVLQPENLIYLSPDPDSPIKITDFGKTLLLLSTISTQCAVPHSSSSNMQ